MSAVIIAVVGSIFLAIATDAYARGNFMLHLRLSEDQFFAIGLTLLVLFCVIAGDLA